MARGISGSGAVGEENPSEMERLGVHFMARQGEGTWYLWRDRGGTYTAVCQANVMRDRYPGKILQLAFPTLASYCTIVACFSAKRLETNP